MSTVPIENRANLPPDAFDRLAAALASQRSVKHAVDWLASHRPPIAPEDLVTQDEYSHDLIVAYPGGLYLSYDST